VDGTSVNAQTLSDAGLIRSVKGLVKVLAMGELGQAYSVEAHKFSAGAAAKIEAAGGSVTTVVPAASETSPTSAEIDEAGATTDDGPATDEPADETEAENDG